MNFRRCAESGNLRTRPILCTSGFRAPGERRRLAKCSEIGDVVMSDSGELSPWVPKSDEGPNLELVDF